MKYIGHLKVKVTTIIDNYRPSKCFVFVCSYCY